MMKPLPIIDSVYAMLIEDESQAEVQTSAPSFSSVSASFSTTVQKPYGQSLPASIQKPYTQRVSFEMPKKPNSSIICKYCKKPGHSID